jgi:hypothetical protein
LKVMNSKADVYIMAFQSLSKTEREAVIQRLLEDRQLREDIQDLLIIRQRSTEQSRRFREYISEKKA